MTGTWLSETLYPSVRVSYEAHRIAARDTPAGQRLEVVQNGLFGTMLVLDGAIQVTTGDEFAYHEMMAHVPIVAHGAARDVLIIGGGDCGLAEEVLKHEAVRAVVQVEIDGDVVAFAREHLAALNAAAFADPRFRLEVGDGARFAAETELTFDVVLVDSTDPTGPGAALFTPAFYADLRRRTRPGGIVVTQSGVPFLQRESFVRGLSALRRAFPLVTAYVTVVPSYFGGHMALGFATDDGKHLSVPAEVLAQRSAGLETRYYSAPVHKAAFALPGFIGEAVREAVEAPVGPAGGL